MAVGFGSSSSINSLDEILGYELLLLSHIRSIKDEVVRFRHVAREDEASLNVCHLIFIERLR